MAKSVKNMKEIIRKEWSFSKFCQKNTSKYKDFLLNTTLHPKSPLKICGIWPISVVFEPNSHIFSKSVRIWLKHHRFWSNSTDVVVLIINILLRRVEFGIWLSNTTEKFEISLGFASWNFKFFCGVWAKFQIPLSAEGCFY